MAEQRPPLVTLIVPVRNEELHVAACLRSVLNQDYLHDRLECLVVDGDSDDSTARLVEDIAVSEPRVRLLRNPDRTMSHGLNVGIASARGVCIGVVSGHSVLPANYVSRLVTVLEHTGAWSVGCRVARVARTPVQAAIARATSSPVGVGDSRHNYATDAGWAESAFPGFWRQEVFDRVGLFDPEMIVNEDNEFSYRIRKAGGGIWYEPSVEVEYVPRATLGGLFRQYHDYARGKIRVVRKHRGGTRWRHFVPAAWVAWLLVGGVIALVASVLRPAWLAGIGIYAIAVLAASVRLHRSGAPWWLIAQALATLHLAYGLGTWRGIYEWMRSAVARS